MDAAGTSQPASADATTASPQQHASPLPQSPQLSLLPHEPLVAAPPAVEVVEVVEVAAVSLAVAVAVSFAAAVVQLLEVVPCATVQQTIGIPALCPGPTATGNADSAPSPTPRGCRIARSATLAAQALLSKATPLWRQSLV